MRHSLFPWNKMGPMVTIFTGNKTTCSLQKEEKIIYLRIKGYQRGLFSKMKKKEKQCVPEKKIYKEIEVWCSEPHPRKKTNERKIFFKTPANDSRNVLFSHLTCLTINLGCPKISCTDKTWIIEWEFCHSKNWLSLNVYYREMTDRIMLKTWKETFNYTINNAFIYNENCWKGIPSLLTVA